MIANIGPETVEEVYALMPSLKVSLSLGTSVLLYSEPTIIELL